MRDKFILPPLQDLRRRSLRDLRISVTDRCNFRCEYCMPADVFARDHRFLAKNQLLTFDEIEILARAFIRLGVRKMRLTGGEPLLRPELEKLAAQLSGLQGLRELTLTTNASRLTAARAAALRQAGVARVNISLDALAPRIYQKINRIATTPDEILRGVENALGAGFDAVKINMVVQKGVNDGEILPMARRFRGSGVILRFIEFMDVGNHNRWELRKVVTADEIIKTIAREYPLRPAVANRPGEVARRWKYADGQGEIGIIASISRPFCGDCARARLSAQGELYTCLFAGEGFDLRKFVRAGADAAELAARIAAVWRRRRDQYSVERAQLRVAPPVRPKVEMSYIGG